MSSPRKSATRAENSAAIFSELERLEQRSIELADRRDDAAIAFAEAKRSRRSALAADAAADTAAIARSVRDFEDEVTTLDEAIEDLNEQIEAVRKRHSTALDQEARADAARLLHKIVANIKEPASRIDEAAKTIGAAVQDILSLIPVGLDILPETIVTPFGDQGYLRATPTQIVSAIVAEAIAANLPEEARFKKLGCHGYTDGLLRMSAQRSPSPGWAERPLTPPTSASQASTDLIADRLELLAHRIENHEADPDIFNRS